MEVSKNISKSRNFLVGIFVSGIGSLPLGYLNLIALQLFILYAYQGLFSFIFGIIFVEIFVIIFTFFFANQLVSNAKLFFWIDIFSILFFTFLAFSFLHINLNQSIDKNPLPIYLQHLPSFLIGVILNGLNFIQLSYWVSWHIFLIQSKKLDKQISIFYVLGACVGTFLGIFMFVILSHYFLSFFREILVYYLPFLFCGIFMYLAIISFLRVIKLKKNSF